jgi:hypothetical protein
MSASVIEDASLKRHKSAIEYFPVTHTIAHFITDARPLASSNEVINAL